MNKFFSLLLFFVIAACPGLNASEKVLYPPLTDRQAGEFYAQLEDEVTLAQIKLNELIQDIVANGSNVAMSPSLLNEITDKAAMVETKKVLAWEFLQKDSIRSPLVRKTLLEVMRMPTIDAEDLYYLQEVTDSEKAKIKEYDDQQAISDYEHQQNPLNKDELIDAWKRLDERQADLDRREKQLKAIQDEL